MRASDSGARFGDDRTVPPPTQLGEAKTPGTAGCTWSQRRPQDHITRSPQPVAAKGAARGCARGQPTTRKGAALAKTRRPRHGGAARRGCNHLPLTQQLQASGTRGARGDDAPPWHAHRCAAEGFQGAATDLGARDVKTSGDRNGKTTTATRCTRRAPRKSHSGHPAARRSGATLTALVIHTTSAGSSLA